MHYGTFKFALSAHATSILRRITQGAMTYEYFFTRLSSMTTPGRSDSTAIGVAKMRIQKFPNRPRTCTPQPLSGGRLIVAKEGPSALSAGFWPTAVGYFA